MEVLGLGVNVLDIIILVFVGISCYLSYKKGFLLALYKVVSFFIAITLAWVLNPLVSTGIKEFTSLETTISENINQSIVRTFTNGAVADTIEQKTQFINKLNVPGFVKDILIERMQKAGEDNVFVDFIVDNLTNVCINVISFIVVILLVMIILSTVKILLKWISNIEVFEKVNKVLGAVFGFINASIKIWIVFMILGLFIDVTSNSGIIVYIKQSFLASLYYNNNLVSYFVAGLLS